MSNITTGHAFRFDVWLKCLSEEFEACLIYNIGFQAMGKQDDACYK